MTSKIPNFVQIFKHFKWYFIKKCPQKLFINLLLYSRFNSCNFFINSTLSDLSVSDSLSSFFDPSADCCFIKAELFFTFCPLSRFFGDSMANSISAKNSFSSFSSNYNLSAVWHNLSVAWFSIFSFPFCPKLFLISHFPCWRTKLFINMFSL